MGQHGRGVLGAKADEIHHVRRQPIAGDALRIVGIAHQNIAFLNAVDKPFRIEGGDISSLSRVDDHNLFFLTGFILPQGFSLVLKEARNEKLCLHYTYH